MSARRHLTPSKRARRLALYDALEDLRAARVDVRGVDADGNRHTLARAIARVQERIREIEGGGR